MRPGHIPSSFTTSALGRQDRPFRPPTRSPRSRCGRGGPESACMTGRCGRLVGVDTRPGHIPSSITTSALGGQDRPSRPPTRSRPDGGTARVALNRRVTGRCGRPTGGTPGRSHPGIARISGLCLGRPGRARDLGRAVPYGHRPGPRGGMPAHRGDPLHAGRGRAGRGPAPGHVMRWRPRRWPE